MLLLCLVNNSEGVVVQGIYIHIYSKMGYIQLDKQRD